MRFLPRVVQTLITSTPDATRVRDNLTAAVQPTLDFLNTYFRQAADGSLQVLRNLSGLGTLNVAGLSTFANDVKVYGGNVTLVSRTGNGLVVVPAGGNPAFFITNSGNTAAVFTADGSGNLTLTGTCTANSLVSAQGIKQTFPAGTLTNVSLNGSGGATTSLLSATGQANMVPMPYAGSVVGCSYTCTSTAYGATFYLARTGTVIWNCPTTLGGGSLQTGYSTSPKGTLSFNAGDYLSLQARGNTTNTSTGVYIQGYITVEMGA